MAIPFDTFLDVLVSRLGVSTGELRNYLNLRPHAMSLDSAYLRELGLTQTQINDIHTLAKNKAKRNKGELSGVPGWDPKTESLLLIGGNNQDRARGISTRINKYIGARSTRSTGVAVSTGANPEAIESEYNTKLSRLQNRINRQTRKHSLNINSTLNLINKKDDLSGELVVLVEPVSLSLGKDIDKKLTDKILKELTSGTGDIDDIEDSVTNNLINQFLGSPLKTGKTTKKAARKLKGRAAKATVTRLPLLDSSASIDLIRLKHILNALLHDAIQANMKTSADASNKSYLRYQTGRFARSAKVERLTQTRAQLNVGYSYQEYPYATFSPPEGKQSSHGRDPKRYIAKSVRDIISALFGDSIKVRSTLV